MKHCCALHAYVLMTSHVHLALTPFDVGVVSPLMQAIGRSEVGCFNARHGRAGTLWESTFKSPLVDNADYVLRCCR